MKERLIAFFKRETVLCAAFLLAAGSMFLVRPDAGYLSYIDVRTLAILFCLMAVMAGLQKTRVFQWTAQALLGRVRSARQLALILVLLCFFSSMLITNDVALITFVPFTFTVLGLAGEAVKERLIIPVVVLQTIAANLGSMLTPIGNPQNLYLYGKAGLSLGAFVCGAWSSPGPAGLRLRCPLRRRRTSPAGRGSLRPIWSCLPSPCSRWRG